MITLKENNYAIRAIIGSLIDCEFGEVKVTLDMVNALKEIKALYNSQPIQFVDAIDDSFKKIDVVSLCGRLNLPYDPDYYIRVFLYYSAQKDAYFIQIFE